MREKHLDQDLLEADRREKITNIVRKFVAYVLLSIGSITTLIPFIWMVTTSFKEKGAVFAYPPEWVPRDYLTTIYNNREYTVNNGVINGEEIKFIETESHIKEPAVKHARVIPLVPYVHIEIRGRIVSPGEYYGKRHLFDLKDLKKTGKRDSYLSEEYDVYLVKGPGQYQGLEILKIEEIKRNFKVSGKTNYLDFEPTPLAGGVSAFEYHNIPYDIVTYKLKGKTVRALSLESITYKPQTVVAKVLRVEESDKLRLTVQFVDEEFGELTGTDEEVVCKEGELVTTDELIEDINMYKRELCYVQGKEDKRFAVFRTQKLGWQVYGEPIANVVKYSAAKYQDAAGKVRYKVKEHFTQLKKVKIVWSNYYRALFGSMPPITLDHLRGFSFHYLILLFWSKIPAFIIYFFNSMFVAASVTLLQLSTSSLAAYSFARLRWKGRNVVFLAYLATMMIPHQVTLIPVFILMKKLNLVDTHTCLILPAAFTAWGTFMLRQFFLSIPESLVEAAHMDGYSKFGILVRIVLPLSKAALATLSVFIFMGSWNNFIGPLIFINSDYLKTLPIGLASFQGAYNTEWTLLMAASVIVMLPVLVFYIFNQRFFTKGIQLQGIKG